MSIALAVLYRDWNVGRIITDDDGRSPGIGIDNDGAFLERIGGDCADAIRIIPEGQENKEEYGYQPVSSESRIPFRKAAGMGLIRKISARHRDSHPTFNTSLKEARPSPTGLPWPSLQESIPGWSSGRLRK